MFKYFMAKKKTDEKKKDEKEEVLETKESKPGFDPSLPWRKQREFA